MITQLLLVRATYIYGVVLHAHPVRGESHNQRNTTGEVATASKKLKTNSDLQNTKQMIIFFEHAQKKPIDILIQSFTGQRYHNGNKLLNACKHSDKSKFTLNFLITLLQLFYCNICRQNRKTG